MHLSPSLHLVDMPRVMSGKGAPRQTIFGVIGMTKYDPYTRSLGGLVSTTSPGKKPRVSMPASDAPLNTDHRIIGSAAKTHISGKHYGQIPYAGRYMAAAGAPVS